jgi:hypothetical protein
MRNKLTSILGAGVLAAAGLVTIAVAVPAAATPSTASAAITTRVVHGGQVTRIKSDTTAGELAPAIGPEAATVKGAVANRSLSSKASATRPTASLSGIPTASSAVTSASGAQSFAGINHHQQRLEVAGGNQWSLEPPDQALCVGNGYVFEAVNNAVAVYSAASGARLALQSLNSFFGYPVEIDRTTGAAGPKQTTDPTCLFDPSTGRFFLTILTYDSDAAGNQVPAGTNTLDTAVSTTGNPLGSWSISHIDATDDGHNGSQNHSSCPCLGDYPHIGVDATGYYITTNEYPDFTDGFNGSQIYAMSKAQLASGATSVTVTQIDTSRAAPGGQPGFTVWPAQSPTVASYATQAGGTEYFLSTDAAEEANNTTGASTHLLTWSLTNTASLATAPNVNLHVVSSTVSKYAVPPAADQKVGPTPLADCLNVTACAKLVLGTPDKFKETERPLDSLDARMQQVTYVSGHLYGSHGTAVDVGSPAVQKAGIAWYITAPSTATNGNLSTAVLHSGRVAVAGNNLSMPTLGARTNGSAVIGVTLAGANHYPSAAYINLTSGGTTSAVRVLAEGVGPEDGFSGYRGFGGRPRWGDYGAAAIDGNGNLWVANEWIGQSCSFAQYQAAPFGECGGTRTALANWSTRISRVAAP